MRKEWKEKYPVFVRILILFLYAGDLGFFIPGTSIRGGYGGSLGRDVGPETSISKTSIKNTWKFASVMFGNVKSFIFVAR